jgi:TPR repeat protein
MVNLGRLYHKGRGVDRDYTKSFNYFKIAAENGNADAQFQLGTTTFLVLELTKTKKKDCS